MVLYKGIYLDISREQIFDLQNYGLDPMYFIEKCIMKE